MPLGCAKRQGKRCLLLPLLLVLLWPQPSAARWSLAPRLGVTSATLGFHASDRLLRLSDPLVGEIPLDNVTLFGAQAGLGVKLQLGQHAALEGRVLVSMQGGRLRGDELLAVAASPNIAVRTIVQSDYELLYLNVPLLVQVGRPWATGRAYAGVGPELGILLDSQVRQEISTAVLNVDFAPLPRPEAARRALAVTVVAGFEFPVRRLHGLVELTFSQGVSAALETGTPPADVRQRLLVCAGSVRF